MFVSAPAFAGEAKICSGVGVDQQVMEFLPSAAGGDQFTISEHGKKTLWTFYSSAGAGIRGRAYKSNSGETAVSIDADIEMDINVEPPDTKHVVIFNDRAFWPCDMRKG